MPIQAGDTIPNVNLYFIGESGGPEAKPAHELLGGKTVVLFAVPGAFTRTCSAKHLPGFVNNADAIKAKGVDEVVCLSVNDAAVMRAWGQAHGADGKVTMLSDGIADFAKAIGLSNDMSARGYGVRSKRYAMRIENNVVTDLWAEPPGEYGVSSAEAVLAQLG
ncbi:MAG: peroxiredoxin [Alphaproteobacteria bacterium]|nr:peroxiredoxin [Alphaproteobacteria bacterium]MCB9928362.1 peroxiredoxin [Alphaproteobacteria bacterium]